MKTLYLILSKLKMMICEDLFFFIVLCIGVLTCNIMFTYMYGVIIQVNEKDGVADINIYHNSGEKFDVDEINDKLSEYKVSLDYYSSLDEARISLNGYEDGLKLEEFNIRARQDVSFFHTNTGNIKGLNRSGTVIVPSDIKGLAIGDTIKLNGIELKIVGSSIVPSFLMSADTFKENGFFPDVVAIDAASKDIGELMKNIPLLFGSGYRIQNMGNQGLDTSAMSTLAIIIVIYLLCVLAFLYLMISIYDSSAYELNVYEMLGASRGRILTVLSSVMLIILAAVSLASQIIHAVFYDVFFSKMNIFGEYNYTVKDYSILFLVTLLSVYAFVFAYICIRVRKSTIVNARKFIA